MSGGGKVNFQTPVPLYEAENRIFGNLPWNNVGQSTDLAYTGIANNLGQFLGGVPSTGQFNAGAANLDSYGNALLPNALTASNAANSVIGNMFNNQQGYYNQLYQQNQDQANAENAMAGVATTPYGAALANQSGLNFNNQWQQFLAGQQAQAANTASTLYGSAGNTLGASGSALGTAANTQEGLQTQQFNAQQQQIQDFLNYALGNTQNASAYTNAVNASTNAGAASTSSLAQAQQSNNSGKSGIGSALGGIGSLIGSFT